MIENETLPERALKVREELFQMLLTKDPEADRDSFENGFQYAFEIQQQLIEERDRALDLAMSNIKMITEGLKAANEKKKRATKILQPLMETFHNPKFRGN
jgi:hypothetical protein